MHVFLTDMPEKRFDKKGLLENCLKMQQNIVENARKAMIDAQESANEEQGGMEEKFESFREQMQQDRDMYARQYEEAVNALNLLKRVDLGKASEEVAFGSVVATDANKYFIAISLGQIVHEGETVYAISPQTPVYLAMVGKKAGDSYQFRDRKVKILDVY